jgi:outer membrane protein assembly factor BamB
MMVWAPFSTTVFSRRGQVAGSLLASSTPASSDQVGDNWPMYRGALNHTGTGNTTPASGTDPTWTYTTGGSVQSSPAVANGCVYVGSGDDYVYCLNATTGAMVWEYTTSGYVESSPAVAGGCVYVGSDDDYVYCLNQTTGHMIWHYKTHGPVTSSPVVINGYVYVGSYDHGVYGLYVVNGSMAWNCTTGDRVESSPGLVFNSVCVGSDDHYLYFLDPTTGAIDQSVSTSNEVSSSATHFASNVYVGSQDGNLYEFRYPTVNPYVWKFNTGGAITTSPALSSVRLYVGNFAGELYCIDAGYGTEYWSVNLGSPITSSAAVGGGHVYVGTQEASNTLFCLDATTGSITWSYKTGLDVTSSPAIASGHVYVGCDDDKVYCFPMNMIPSQPLNVQTTLVSNQIALQWQAPNVTYGLVESPVTAYNIYRGTASGKEVLYSTVGNVTQFIDWGAQAGQTYYYQVTAIGGSGEGLQSNEVSVSTSDFFGANNSVLAIAGVAIALGIVAICAALVLHTQDKKQIAKQAKAIKELSRKLDPGNATSA